MSGKVLLLMTTSFSSRLGITFLLTKRRFFPIEFGDQLSLERGGSFLLNGCSIRTSWESIIPFPLSFWSSGADLQSYGIRCHSHYHSVPECLTSELGCSSLGVIASLVLVTFCTNVFLLLHGICGMTASPKLTTFFSSVFSSTS